MIQNRAKMQVAVAAALGFIGMGTASQAGSLYWDGNGATAGAGAAPSGNATDVKWSLDPNGASSLAAWNNTAPGNTADIATFAAGTDAVGPYTFSLNSGLTAGGVTIEEGAVTFAGVSAFTIGTGNVTLADNTSLITTSSARISMTSGSKYILGNNTTLKSTNAGNLGSFVNTTAVVQLSGSTNFEYNETASPAPMCIYNATGVATTGTGTLHKTGVGILAFASNATGFTGNVVIDNGELRLRFDNNRFAATSGLTVNSPGIFNMANLTQTFSSLSGDGTIGGGGATTGGTLTINGSTDSTFSGSFNDTAFITATTPGGTTGTGKLVKSGTSTLTLSGTNAYTGTTTVNGGTLQATKPAALAGYNVSGKVIVNTATVAVNVGGAGEWAAGDIDTLRANATLNSGAALGFDSTNGDPGTPFVYSSNISDTNAGANTLGITKLGANTVNLSGTLSYTGGTTVKAGTLVVNRVHGLAADGTGTANPVNITGGTLQVAESSPKLSDGFPSGNNADISRPGGMVSIANDGGALGSRVYNGTLDLTNNDLVIDYSSGTPLADVRDMIRSGYNGGNWKGTGITSSTAANPAAFGNFALGYADNSALVNKYGDGTGDGSPAAGNAGHGPLFFGQSVDLTTVLVKFTHRVDLNLDGFITSNDASIFNGSYNEGQPATWSTGDLNYNGVFDTNDASIFNGAYNEALASLPEPSAAIGVLGVSAIGAMRRRRGAARQK